MSEELPQGWTTSPLGQIAKINPRHPRGLDDSMQVTFTTMAALSESEPNFNFTEERLLGRVRKGFTHYAEGDVLFAKITPCMENGKGAVATGLSNALGCGTTELHIIRPYADIDPYFIYYYLAQDAVRREAKENFTGTAGQARVPVAFIKDLEIPLPPIAEQKRIVEKLGLLLAKARGLQTRLEGIPTLLKRFRQSVLAAASSGRLTADWRRLNPNVQLISQALDALKPAIADLQVRRGVPEEVPESVIVAGWRLPETWGAFSSAALLRSGAILDIKDGNHGANHPKVSEFTAQGLPFITAAQVNNFRIDYEGAYKISGEALARIRVGRAVPGDVIYTHKGSVGRVAITDRECILTPQTTYYRVSPNLINPRFLMYYLASPAFAEQVDAIKEQTTRDFVPISEQYLLFHRLPPLEEQKEIARRVDAIFKFADRIESGYDRASKTVKGIKGSILAKAFSGELVPTEAELAAREGRNYESASQLLERVCIDTPQQKSSRKNGGDGQSRHAPRPTPGSEAVSAP